MRNAISDLVVRRHRTQYGRLFVESCTLVGSVLLLELAGGESVTRAGLATLAVLIGLVLALVAGVPMARLLAAMRKERLLEHIQVTALGPAEVVDGITLAAVRVAWPAILALAVLLSAAAALCGWPWVDQAAMALWGPAVLLSVVLCCYVVQSLWLVQAGLLLALAAALAFLPGVAAIIPVVCVALITVLCARDASLTVARLPHGDPVVRRRPRLRVDGVRNAIVMREMTRMFHRRKGAWPAVVVGEAVGLPLVLLGSAVVLRQAWGAEGAATFVLIALFTFQPLRAAWRSGTALVLERDRGTLELLQQSTLTAQQFVDGWALSAMTPTLVETLVALPFALWSCSSLGSGSSLTLDLVLLVVLSAYLGIMMSSVAPNRTIAHRFLHFWSALYIGFGVVPVALAAFTGAAANQGNLVFPPLLGLGCVVIFRQVGMQRVQDDPVITGFSQ